MEFKEYTGKTVEDALTEASIALGTTSENIEYEVVEEGKGGLFKAFSKEAVIRARRKEGSEDGVMEFLENVLEKMEIEHSDIEIVTDEDEAVIYIDVKTENTGDLIGKKGQTLDALQYLLSIIANRGKEKYYKVKLDTKDYRARRQKTLENLAKNVASKVKKTRRKVTLDPMNPNERRIIHSYLQSDAFVETKSEGEEPYRRVVVYYKRG